MMKIMDYSMYLVVEHADERPGAEVENRNRAISIDGTEIYHFGIIDYLQEWNVSKKCEHCFKSLNNDRDMISAVEPLAYMMRFQDYMSANVFVEDKTREQDETISNFSKMISQQSDALNSVNKD